MHMQFALSLYVCTLPAVNAAKHAAILTPDLPHTFLATHRFTPFSSPFRAIALRRGLRRPIKARDLSLVVRSMLSSRTPIHSPLAVSSHAAGPLSPQPSSQDRVRRSRHESDALRAQPCNCTPRWSDTSPESDSPRVDAAEQGVVADATCARCFV
ncbi:uncharacterized protein C8Q71DRAFT_379946 [Rhodofomes roseus]|uniref:Secreted protein n=1 Tax=Rhodofomes roseus TaxID=34475 RepID=A0ABQ8K0G2_9APHY|nr:uncharacterized protein C8Q71DRAFT_379946 [Rhodofomes roseus]KAH9830142.1 hypothetical protein C8Q71DRAFT_379946 [Rhodofomes roseus]